ncbi:MAG: hypothetical protein R3D58_08465 [Saprospiraceae bacterium]|nr:hypothetical protein [Lewinellaceae bacterium]
MKRVTLSDLPSMEAQSEVLDQALYLLANSPVQFRSSDLCRLLGVHASVLTRMKLVHCNPQYEPFVNQYALIKVLKYLFQCFPTLVLSKTCQGEFVVRLFKRCGNHKLENSPVHIPADEFFKQNAPKPGSTRWYLEQEAQGKLGGFGSY